MSEKDNGKKQPEKTKTSEVLAEERLQRYKAEPKNFVELSDIIHMTIRNPNSPLGISVFMGHAKRSEVDLSWAELNFNIQGSLAQMSIASKMKQEAAKGMIHKAGGFLSGIRGMKR